MNEQLERSLASAASGNDISSLKALARQESNRADNLMRLLVAVLEFTGPVTVPRKAVSGEGDIGRFKLVNLFDGTVQVYVDLQPAVWSSGSKTPS